MTLETAFNNVLAAVLSLAAVLISAYLIPWIKAQHASGKYQELEGKITGFVRYAEQMRKTLGWSQEEAKQRALLVAQEVANSLKLNIDIVELDRMIEAAVNQVSNENKTVKGELLSLIQEPEQ